MEPSAHTGGGPPLGEEPSAQGWKFWHDAGAGVPVPVPVPAGAGTGVPVPVPAGAGAGVVLSLPGYSARHRSTEATGP